MFVCRQISLTQFRNYTSSQFNFKKDITGICGNNGSGKTNLLDAIYYLCFTKSAFSTNEQQNVKEGFNGLRLQGNFVLNENEFSLVAIVRETGRKEFSVNDVNYSKLSEHIGRFPCVMIAPDDVSLITEGSDERRKFIDTLISQIQHDYLEQLITYNKILLQRNSFLKQAAERNYYDEQLLEIINRQLAAAGNFVYASRKKFSDQLLPLIKNEYTSIAGKQEALELNYESHLQDADFSELLQQNFQRDLYLQRTGNGIHKDDIEMLLGNNSFKSIASQGQRKSLLFACKLAAFKILRQQKNIAPILLLDDVFEKLDEERMNNLLQYVCNESGAQVFITDTHKERLQQAFMKIGKDYDLIEL